VEQDKRRMYMKEHILTVDDDHELGRSLVKQLERNGFEATYVDSIYECIEALKKGKYSLMILDIHCFDEDNKPDETAGLRIAREIRAQGITIPIIFLTAHDTERYELDSLGLGDDFITKPYSESRLIARINTVLRRCDLNLQLRDERVYKTGDLVFNIRKMEVTVGGKHIHLTPAEYKLLEHLLEHMGIPVTFKSLYERISNGVDYDAAPNYSNHSIREHISTLRSKIEPDPPQL